MSTGEAKLSSAASSAIKPPTCPPRALLTPVRACQDTHGVGRPGTYCNHHHTLLFTCKGAETRTPMFTGTQTLTPGPNCSWAHPLSRLGHPGHAASCSAILPARSPPSPPPEQALIPPPPGCLPCFPPASFILISC